MAPSKPSMSGAHGRKIGPSQLAAQRTSARLAARVSGYPGTSYVASSSNASPDEPSGSTSSGLALRSQVTVNSKKKKRKKQVLDTNVRSVAPEHNSPAENETIVPKSIISAGTKPSVDMKNAAQQDLDGPIQKLYHNSSPAAAFNSRNRLDSPKCHPKTRIRLLDAILNWADDGSPRIMWLYGAAGAGKSTISQTVCEEICAGSNLAASFFFSRMAPVECHCGHEGGFVATIAYQLTVAIPGLRRYVEQVILTRPSVFALAIREQVLALILNPLSRLIHDKGEDNNFPQPRIIIVDGLDECREEASQEQVLDAITTLVQHQDIFPFSVFLSSRPVPVIHSWFSATEAKSPTLVQRISLQDHCDGDRDIEMFFMDQAADIRQSHPFRDKIPVNWPSPVLAKEVAQRASGKIVYASTVMKYVKDPRHHPHHRLMSTIHDKIATPDRPNLELDTLYLHILRQTKHPRLVHRILAFQMTTLPFYNTLSDNYSKENICSFLSLSGDVDALFVDLDPILNYGINRERAHPVVPTRTMFYHQSFPDFLLDLQRSEEFYVDIQRFDNEFCEISLDHICNELREDTPRETYVAYCFLILLQSRAPLRSQQIDQIREALSRWGSLDKIALYNSLEELTPMAFTKSKRDVVANIDRNLWRKFLDILQPIPHNHFNQAYEKLDTFYLYTLRQTKDPIAAHRLLAFCVFLTSIRVRERTTHEDFVDFCESFLALPSSIDILLSDLSSIMHQDMDVILDQDGPCRRFAHLGQEHLDIPVSRIFHYESFVAFLLDHRRAKEFYIDVEEFDRIFYELAMEGISVPRYLRLAPGDPYKKRSKVIYCFAILLQSETATTEWEAGEVVEALQKWDSFDENMLYDVMELVLSGKSGDNTVESRFLTLLESTPAVRHIFVAALKRKRVQYHNSLASSNLPAEFFAFFRGVDESMLAFPLSVTPEKVDLTLLMVVHIHHSCKKLLQWDMWGFLQHHPLQSSSWFTIARILADCQVKHEGGSEQLEYEDLDWGSVICEVSAAVLYYIKQIIALFDPSPDITRPQEVLDAFGYLEGTIGPHWREIAALELLRYIQSSLWSECHISDEIVSALKELSDCLFPPDIVSTLENTALSSLPIYSSKHKTSSAFLDSPCALPRWYLGGFDEQAVFEPDMENNLGSIHDYVRLYDIYNNPASGDRDTTGSGSDRGTNKTDGIEADVLVSETKDPHAGGHIDYVSWSFDSRIARYKNSLRMQVARSQEEEQEQEES